MEVVRPPWAAFSPVGAADAALDSDVDPLTGRHSIDLRSDQLTADAGLTGTTPEPDGPGVLPAARVGPIRSGRLVYGHIAAGFQDSCLIFAGASPQVMSELPVCYQVFHQLEGGGYMIDIAEMREVAQQNARAAGSDFEYGSNGFDPQPPAGGTPASRLDVYFAYLNQSAWQYDPLYQAYLRFVDTSSYDEAGILRPDVDRLTGHQVHVENVIVVFARHDVISPSNLDIRLDPGRSGPAVLFRNGMSYRIRWNTFGADQEAERPMQFTDQDNRPFPLKPGHTWVIVATLASSLQDGGNSAYRLNFVPPEGAD
jgi:hypothetical protein